MGAGGKNAPGEVGDAYPADTGGEAVRKLPKEGGGWGAGTDPPSALAYDSEEERLEALVPETDADVLMEKRKQKAQNMLAKKPGITLGPRKRYAQRKEERLYERQKAAAAAAARLEAAKEAEENKRMVLEELRSWDAYELNFRNHRRMIEKEKEDRAQAAKKLHEEEERRLACEEEGLTFDHGVVMSHRRWRASSALATVLPAHPCPAHAMRQSGDGRWILSGGDDLIVRLWDTEAFARKLSDSNNEKKAAKAATLVGAVSANLALGWECARELVGHTAAVRDVEFNPLFDGPPKDEDAAALAGGQDPEGAGEDAPQTEGATVRLACVLASASTDLTVRIWDLSFNPRTARRFVLRGHKGVVYACKFAPSGDVLASCSADGTLRMWNVLDEFRERLKIPQTVLDQCEGNPCPTQAVSNGFSLTVTIVNDTGKDTRTEEYYRGCKLVLRARALKKFTGLYVAGVSAEGLWEGFEAIFRFPTITANRIVLGSETVWVTLRERPPPTPPAALFAAKRLKPRKRNFDTVGRTELFAKALKTGDWAEATMMLSAPAVLQFAKVKATGAAEVAEEIRQVLGRNVIVHNGLSPDRHANRGNSRRPHPEFAGFRGHSRGHCRYRPPCRGRSKRLHERRPKSSGTLSLRNEKKRGRGRGKHRGSSTDRSSGDEERAEDRESLVKRAQVELAQLKRLKAAGVASWKELGEATGLLSLAKSRKRKKANAKGQGKGLLGAAGIQVKDPKVNLKVLVWDGFFGADMEEMRMPLPDLYPSTSTPYDQNEDFAARTLGEAIAVGDKAAPALIEEMRAERKKKVDTVEKMVDAVLDGDEKLRKIATRRRDAIVSPSDLAASYPTPDARLAPLPRNPLYPLGNGQNYRPPERGFENEKGDGQTRDKVSVSPATSKEALLLLLAEGSGEGNNGQAQNERVSSEPENKEDVKEHEEGGKQMGDDHEDFSSVPSANTPGGGDHTSAASSRAMTMTLPPLEASVVHTKLEGTASREKRQREEARLAKQAPPVDPPDDVDLTRRRGGLGVLPGGASLVEVPAVGDWEKQVARENGGLLRELETRFGGLVCHQDTINAVSYSPDGRRLASASSDGTVKLWDPSAGKQVRMLTGHHEGLPVWDVAWSGDSMFLVSCGADRSLVIWNTAAAEPFVRRFLGHSDHVKRCAFADTRGEAVLSCGSDGTVRRWVLTPNVPAPPPKPFVTHKTRTWVMVNWRPAAGSNEQITAYVVSWRLGRKGKFDDELTVAGDQLRRDVTGLLPGSLYFFRVAGVNRMGQGPWSETTDMVDTEMDLPLAMDRPSTEAVTPDSITISFFAPRPTLPKMKIQRFVLQAKGGGLDFDEGDSQEFSWDEAISGAATLRGRRKMQAKAQRESIISVTRARSVTSTATGGTGVNAFDGASGECGSDGGGKLASSTDTSQEAGCTKAVGGAGEDGGSTESGSVGTVKLGSFANVVHGEEGTAAGDESSRKDGSVRIVALGSSADSTGTGKGPAMMGAEGTGAAERAVAEQGGDEQRASAGGLSPQSFPMGDTKVTSPTREPARGSVVEHGACDQRGGVGIVRLGSFANGNIDTGPTAADGAGWIEGTAATAATIARLGEAVTGQNRDDNAQGAQNRLVRLGTFARRNTRIGRVDQNLRKKQRRGRKAHHYLMSLTYNGLKPGIDYHIRVAGVSSVGKGAFSLPTYSARTPAVPPHACPPPTPSTIFLTAILVSWVEGDDGGSSVTGFILRPTGGGGAEEVLAPRTKRSHLFERLLKGRTYSFQVRAVNNEGIGPWSEPSQPARTLTQRPSAPRAPALSLEHPSPGPLSLWLSLFLPDEDGGDPVTAMLLETRRHGGIQPPEWSRCERHPVPSDLATTSGREENSDDRSPKSTAVYGDGSVRGASNCSRSVVGELGGSIGQRQLGRGGGVSDGTCMSVASKATACCEVVVLVEGLQPRTYYSFRASAVNARGAGDPGPPCRRVRTAAPRPPSWFLARNDSSAAAAEAEAATTSAATNTSAVETRSTSGARARLPCSPPRAACSGLGACTVRWEEPFSNGAAVEFYEVEGVRIGPKVAHIDVGAACIGKEHEDLGKGTGDREDEAKRQQARERSESASMFRRSVPSHLRHLVVRGLATGGDYVFRVAGSNTAGLGKPGPWTEVVRVEDPADQG
ncbi:unnamed protein product [Scytosiphon promiscuus]